MFRGKIDYQMSSADYGKTLWRYMDFTKFIDLLENSTLFFPKVELFEDKFEGIHNGLNYDSMLNFMYGQKKDIKDSELKIVDYAFEHFSDIINQLKNSCGISCWRLSEYESHAMWKIFLSSNEGIAIRTNIGKLKNNLQISESQNIFLGPVKYINYNSQQVPLSHVYSFLFHKNKYFEHESEFRVIVGETQEAPKKVEELSNGYKAFDLAGYDFMPFSQPGLNVGINYRNLIEEIIISPYAPNWFFKLVEKVARDKYEIDVPITRSGIEFR